MSAGGPLPVGLIGAGRTRSGLGPFLARFLEQHGCRVTAVAGRNAGRARQNAEDLGRALGHPVRGCASVSELCRGDLAALVIASPPGHHLEALQAALLGGLPVLCEKPLVACPQLEAGLAVVAGFASRGLLLFENCQWPFVLPVLRRLYPDLPAGPARSVLLGLGPARPGRAMLEESLSHLLSLCQAVAPVGQDTRVAGLELQDPTLRSQANVLRLRLQGAGLDLAAELHVVHSEQPPRPAWLSLDGARIDRRIGGGYALSFHGAGRELPAPDPLGELVARFVQVLRAPDPGAIRREHAAVRDRLRLYCEVMAGIA